MAADEDDEDHDCSRVNNALSSTALETLALGGAQPEVIEQVRANPVSPLQSQPCDCCDRGTP